MVATGTGGSLDTLIFAYETCPPLVATMFAVPSARATTTPPVETAAMLVSSVDHCTGNPSTAAPVESRGVPINCVLFPTMIGVGAGRHFEERHRRLDDRDEGARGFSIDHAARHRVAAACAGDDTGGVDRRDAGVGDRPRGRRRHDDTARIEHLTFERSRRAAHHRSGWRRHRDVVGFAVSESGDRTVHRRGVVDTRTTDRDGDRAARGESRQPHEASLWEAFTVSTDLMFGGSAGMARCPGCSPAAFRRWISPALALSHWLCRARMRAETACAVTPSTTLVCGGHGREGQS